MEIDNLLAIIYVFWACLAGYVVTYVAEMHIKKIYKLIIATAIICGSYFASVATIMFFIFK